MKKEIIALIIGIIILNSMFESQGIGLRRRIKYATGMRHT